MNDVQEAQRDMRDGYYSGGAGILASSLAWIAAAATVAVKSPEAAVWVLFAGGMLIHPASILICKMLGARGGHAKGNPLGALAIATTFWLIFSLPLVYVASLQKMAWFFPAMLLVIGGRYLTFASLYGMRIFWGLGFALAGAGFGLGYVAMPPLVSASAGAAIELVFAIVVMVLHGRWKGSVPSAA